MDTNYKIQSKYIKKKIKGKKYTKANCRYIDNLIDIEKIVLGKYCSTGTGYVRKILSEKYPKEFKQIYLELNPKEYAIERILEQKERRKNKKSILKMNEEMKKEKQFWKKYNGII